MYYLFPFIFLSSSLAIAAVMPDQITKYEVEMKLYGSLSSLSAEESSTLVSRVIITISAEESSTLVSRVIITIFRL